MSHTVSESAMLLRSNQCCQWMIDATLLCTPLPNSEPQSIIRSLAQQKNGSLYQGSHQVLNSDA